MHRDGVLRNEAFASGSTGLPIATQYERRPTFRAKIEV
jgi:hypothetical protein